MSSTADTKQSRLKRKTRVRKKISGTATRPRLSIFRTASHIYAQLIDDTSGITIVSASTLIKDLVKDVNCTGNIEAAKLVGAEIARRSLQANVNAVVFDRGGFLFHGRVKALAESARENGLSF